MTERFEYLIDRAPLLARYRGRPDSDRIPAMVRRLGVASRREQVLITIVLCLIPDGLLQDILNPEELERVPRTYTLKDMGTLDAANTPAVVEVLTLSLGRPDRSDYENGRKV